MCVVWFSVSVSACMASAVCKHLSGNGGLEVVYTLSVLFCILAHTGRS